VRQPGRPGEGTDRFQIVEIGALQVDSAARVPSECIPEFASCRVVEERGLVGENSGVCIFRGAGG
jgi:hypothetical protein